MLFVVGADKDGLVNTLGGFTETYDANNCVRIYSKLKKLWHDVRIVEANSAADARNLYVTGDVSPVVKTSEETVGGGV